MSETLASWIERVRRLVAYQQEALEFLERVRRQFPLATPQHALAVARLWALADEVDPFLCTLLEELNRGLLEGKGQMDTTRGAYTRKAGVPPLPGLEDAPGLSFSARPTMCYECTWSLKWDDGKAVAVQLTVEPENDLFRGAVIGHQARLARDVPCPLRPGERPRFEEGVREALLECFASEVISRPESPDLPASRETLPPARRSRKKRDT
ncbi:MAG: hypothetical protein NZ951_01220 [Dehalococcoidia bacterium]|nr:hypothetical protein [Dehalococcoidia bacterium]MDW8119259.1 hypothetical protein [Chloroflexota bacterium]